MRATSDGSSMWTSVTVPRWLVTSWPSAAGARVTIRSPTANGRPSTSSAGPVQEAGVVEPLSGLGVEGGHVGSPPGVHGGVGAGQGVVHPGVHRPSQRLGAIGGRVDAAVRGVPGDRGGDGPGSEMGEDATFVVVVLAHVVRQGVDGTRVALGEAFQAAAGADRAELPVVTDQHDLRAGQRRLGEQPQHGRVIDHRGLIDDEDGALVEVELMVVEPPQQRGHRPGLDVRIAAQGAGGLPGGGGAHHRVPGGLEGHAGGVEHRRLARAGHAEHDVESSTGGGDPDGGVRLPDGERMPELGFLGPHGVDGRAR